MEVEFKPEDIENEEESLERAEEEAWREDDYWRANRSTMPDDENAKKD